MSQGPGIDSPFPKGWGPLPEVGEGLPLRGGMGWCRDGVVVWGACQGV